MSEKNRESHVKAWISGGARTLAQFVPGVGGAIAQAWSEYSNNEQAQRVEEYFTILGDRLLRLERMTEDLRCRIGSMSDAAELLERTVEAAIREPEKTKRIIYPILYSHFLTDSKESSTDDRVGIIDHVEHLSIADISLLREFKSGNPIGGEVLIPSSYPTAASSGASSDDNQWLSMHGDLVHRMAKLISRGVIIETYLNRGMVYQGSSNSSFNRFRSKAWIITPMGKALVRATQE